ncbi:hypothetical protein [Fibrella aestuarina]|uniref:hypothetical protein n=1 Tax=Fibrella aestuarina TaxID=651143 RepID=UPI00059C8E19|nr:hypothetical protein [Fibrella aestuarina]
MRKSLVSFIIVAVISFITAYLLLKVLDNFPSTSESKNKSIDKTNKNIRKDDSIKYNSADTIRQIDNKTISDSLLNSEIEKQKLETEILYSAEQAQKYTNSPNKSVSILNYHLAKLEKLYKIKGLSDEQNDLLKKTIIKIKKVKTIKRNSHHNSRSDSLSSKNLKK